MKVKRSERLIDMTHYLMEHPRELVSLTFFADRFLFEVSGIVATSAGSIRFPFTIRIFFTTVKFNREFF